MRISESYNGHVEPGEPARTRAGGVIITKTSVGPMDNNAYLLTCESSGQAVLIDAAAESETLMELLGHDPDRPQLVMIITTHQHPDHWQALGHVGGATGAELVAHPLDADPLPAPVDRMVEQGDIVQVGEFQLEVLHLRGHTPGSIALLLRPSDGSDPQLFTGDSLFPGGVGKTTSPEDFRSLLEDVQSRVFDELPDATWVYPGHGDDTTLGQERPKLAQWRERGW